MRRNNDKMLLESLVRKYGKNGVVKTINEMEETNNNHYDVYELRKKYFKRPAFTQTFTNETEFEKYRFAYVDKLVKTWEHVESGTADGFTIFKDIMQFDVFYNKNWGYALKLVRPNNDKLFVIGTRLWRYVCDRV